MNRSETCPGLERGVAAEDGLQTRRFSVCRRPGATDGDEVCPGRSSPALPPEIQREIPPMLHFPLLIAPLAASLIGLGAILAVRRIALAVGFVDNPDLWRKLHEAPIPLGGGLAV